MHNINTQFIKSVYFESNLIHLQQCHLQNICSIFVLAYFCSIFAEIISRKRILDTINPLQKDLTLLRKLRIKR